MPGRRRFLSLIWGSTLCAALAGREAAARPKSAPDGMRGSIDIAGYGLAPDRQADQSVVVQRLFKAAAATGMPVFLPAGDYRVSDLALPDGLSLRGVPGRTRLVYGGGGRFITASEVKRLSLSDIVFDGQGKPLNEETKGLLTFAGVATLTIDNCGVTGASRHAVALERCGGRIEANDITSAGWAGLYTVDSAGLAIVGNTVADCGNGGILVHRFEAAEDATLVTGNRVSRIAARDGGTGQNGNGINIFRAGNVIVSGNHIVDCAFSAIRANSATDVQVSGNQCLRSGETAIYSEFGFEGAIVSGNLIDGAANGILIVNFDEGGRLATVSGNIVRNLHADGPYIHEGAGFGFGIAAEADTVISANVIENVPKWGLMLGWGPYLRNVVATGNLVRSAGGGCAVTVVEGAGAAVIADNLFQDVRDGGVIGYRWTEKATGDLLSGSGAAYRHLTLSGNRVV